MFSISFFVPSDDCWITHVANPTFKTVNVYLLHKSNNPARYDIKRLFS